MVVKLLIFLTFFVSCAEKDNQVQSPFLILKKAEKVQENDPHFGYSLEPTQLTTLSSLTPISGKAAQLYWGVSGRDYSGDSVMARYREVESGYKVPMDFKSLAALTVYSFYEEFFLVEQENAVSHYLQWPRRVHLGGLGKKGGAFHVPNQDLTYFNRPGGWETLPTYFNQGVAAHEHFHEYFSALVEREQESKGCQHSGAFIVGKKRNKEEVTRQGRALSLGELDLFLEEHPDVARLADQYVLRGWNEGLADFWGYLYTQDPKYLLKSLPVQSNRFRSLDFSRSLFSLKGQKLIRERGFYVFSWSSYQLCKEKGSANKTQEDCLKDLLEVGSYELGASIAHYFYIQFQQRPESFHVKRAIYQKAILGFLSESRDLFRFSEYRDNELILLNRIEERL